MATRVDLPPPPVTLDEHAGGGSDWVHLVHATNDIDAHLLEGRLQEAGIEVRRIKDRSGPVWLHGGSNPWAPVAIWVRRYQLDDSRLVLAELSFNSPAVPQREPTRSGWPPVAWWSVAIALGILLSGIGLALTAEYLDRCGFDVSCGDPRSLP